MRTRIIPFSVSAQKIPLNYPNSTAMRFFSKGLKNEFETAMVNESSMFKALKFY